MSHWEITIKSNFAAIREASHLLQTYCDQCDISHELCGQLELIMVEALNNVIKHAYRGKDGHEVHIEIIDNPQFITIRIKDVGIAANIFDANSDITFPDEDFLPEGGWGLPLIQVLTDSISYESTNKRNLLTLTKKR